MRSVDLVSDYYARKWYQVERMARHGGLQDHLREEIIPELNLRRRGDRGADLSPGQIRERVLGAPNGKPGEWEELLQALQISGRKITPDVLHELADIAFSAARRGAPIEVLKKDAEVRRGFKRVGLRPEYSLELAVLKYGFRNEFGNRPDVKKLEIELLRMHWDGGNFYHPN